MAMTETRYPHVVLDDKCVPHIAGTTMKVEELVLAHQAYGWSPEELVYQFPYLTLGQVHGALAYYWDHKQEIDEDIARRDILIDEIQQRTPVPPFVERLRKLRAG